MYVCITAVLRAMGVMTSNIKVFLCVHRFPVNGRVNGFVKVSFNPDIERNVFWLLVQSLA